MKRKPRYCCHCNKLLQRRPDETTPRYGARRFCDASCHDAYKEIVAADKAHEPCYCGKEVIRVPGESVYKWLKRKTCCQKCSITLRIRHVMDAGGKIPVAEVKPRIIRELNIDFSGQNLPFANHYLRTTGPSHNYSISGSSMGWTGSTSGEGAV